MSRARANALYEAVLAPLRGSLGNATHLVISPDGALNLVPFEALVDERGAYLIERYATSYVTSGRDLLRMQIAHPATESSGDSWPIRFSESHRSKTATVPMYFAPLGATGLEAQAIKRLFSNATLLVGSDATKARLQQVKAPEILHIASHGFFLEDLAHGDTQAAAAGKSAAAIGVGARRRERGARTDPRTAS